MRETPISILEWVTYYRLSTLKTTLFSPYCGKIMNFGWVTLSVSSFHLSPSPVNLLSCLFVRLSLVSLILPLILFSLPLPILLPHFLSALQCPRQPGLSSGGSCRGSSSCSALYFSAQLIFILSNISNNFTATTAGPELHASCLSLVGAYNMMWLDKLSLSTQFSCSSSLSSRKERKTQNLQIVNR